MVFYLCFLEYYYVLELYVDSAVGFKEVLNITYVWEKEINHKMFGIQVSHAF